LKVLASLFHPVGMPSAASKAAVVGLALNFVLACGLEDPNPAESEGTAGSASDGSTAGGGAGAGMAGATATAGSSAAGSATGGSSVGGTSAGAPSAGAPGAGSGGQASGGSGGSGGGSAGAGGSAGSGGGTAAPFVLTSPMLTHVEACTQQNREPCSLFLKDNEMTAIGGDNKSPALSWGAGPVGTMSYAVVLHDFSNGFTHWAIWNIPASTLMLPASLARDVRPAVPAGSQQKSFDMNNAGFGYMGPGADDHMYEFKLYALNAATFTPKSPGEQGKVRDELEANAGNFVLGKSILRGRSKKYN
jgi:Raf kinase inhibitor-like YbhB/YbcL family protein